MTLRGIVRERPKKAIAFHLPFLLELSKQKNDREAFV